mgnify:CR=1 FL=1
MYKCPICNKIKDASMDLARHMVMPSGDEILDTKHKAWVNQKNLDLSNGWKPLAELLSGM